MQVLHKITPQVKTITKLYCDNEQVVTRLNQIQYQQYPFSIKAATESEHDFLFEIKEVIKGLPRNLGV